jgi:ribonuclease Z
MKRLALAVVAAVAAAFAILWFVPSVQDALIARVARERLLSPADLAFDDDTLSALLCGTASPLAHPTRGHPCTAVIAGGRIYIVDAGPGAWTHLALWRVPADRIDSVLLTHLHSDHIGELGELNLQSWAGGRSAPMPVYGPAGTERVVRGFLEAYAIDTGYRTAHHGAELLSPAVAGMDAREIALGADGAQEGSAVVLERDGLVITAFLVHHQPVEPAFGYRFEYKGRSIFVSGDTAPHPSLADAAKDVDVLVHEAQANHLVKILHDVALAGGFTRQAKILGDIPSYHTSPVDAAKLAKAANAKLLVFTHLTPPPINALMERIFVRGVDDVSGPRWILGDDGLVIELPANSAEIRTRSIAN